MSKKFVCLFSIALAVIALMAGVRRLRAVDVSQFLTQESSVSNLAWGSPGGIACDGINFLIAAQSTNGRITAIRLATNGIMPGPPLDLGRNGGLPRVAFDGDNYLVAWPDFATSPSAIYGQFIHPDGAMIGSPFLIADDVGATEMGGLAFDGTNYLAVWEANALNSNAVVTVQGRFITPAGGFPGASFEISDGTNHQKFPDVAWNGEAYLVAWTAQTEGTNEWNVRGRKLNRDGLLASSVTIGQHPAQQPWPPTLASDGTNWLVAWTRESGPYPVLTSNLWLPMLYCRIVVRDGTVPDDEIQVRWGGLGQFKAKATFQGENYLVGWMEKERRDQDGPPRAVSWYWQPAVRELNRSGQPVLTEFWVWRIFNFYPIDPPGLALGAGAGRFLVAWEQLYNNAIWESFLIPLNRSFALRNLTKLADGELQFDLLGPNNRSYGVEVTTNWVNWSAIINPKESFNVYPTGRITVAASMAGPADHRFFRAFDGQTTCRENQRLIEQAKEHWALEHNKESHDYPVDSDLFGPGKYLLVKPLCPNGGAYSLEGMVSHVYCTLEAVAGHSL